MADTKEMGVVKDLVTLRKYETVLGKQVNRIVIGTARVAAEKKDGIIVPKRDRDPWEIDLLEYSLNKGLNFLDTAQAYGDAEIIIGQAIKPHDREKIVIATKVGLKPAKPDEIRRAINERVERLGTVPDIIFIHDRWEGLMGKEMEGCIAELDHAVEAGLAKGIGISNFRPDELKRAIETAKGKVVAYQGKLNFLNPRPDVSQLLQICKENNIIFMASSALDRGAVPNISNNKIIIEMAEKYGMTVAQLAIFSLLTEERVLPIVQSHQKDHIDQNLQVFNYSVDKSDSELLRRLLPSTN